MPKPLPRLIAILQFAGGAALLASCGHEMLAQPLHVIQITLYLAFLLYAGIMCFYAIRLWHGVPPCYKPSALLWLAQIPLIHSGFFSYQLMTGLSIAAVIEARADGMSIGIDSLLAE
jgi:hypothetical protein